MGLSRHRLDQLTLNLICESRAEIGVLAGHRQSEHVPFDLDCLFAAAQQVQHWLDLSGVGTLKEHFICIILARLAEHVVDQVGDAAELRCVANLSYEDALAAVRLILVGDFFFL